MAKKDLKSHVQQKSGWKGGKKGSYKYEGEQYRGGRQSGRKNLTKLDNGNLLNQHGVVFTPGDKKALERAVNKASAYRKRMIEKEGQLDRLVDGKPTGQKVATLQAMGKESDFIIARRSKSLQRFKSREDFEKYLSATERASTQGYLDERTRLYKRNHMSALENVFGDDAKDVVMKIRMMKPDEYRKLLQSDENLEVSYVYDPSQASAKLNQIRLSLGMNPKEEMV